MVIPAAASALYSGVVMHRRLDPAHRFEYPLFMWLLDLDELPRLPSRVRGFGLNCARPVAFHDRDHFEGTAEPPVASLRRLVERHGVAWPGGPVRVLTHCRVLGYVFNPVSFWYCHAPGGRLEAVVAEVNNTFGERHCYVSRAVDPACAAGDRPVLHWQAKKVFHVSPFFSLDGSYRFSVDAPGPHLRARIDLTAGGALQLVTALALEREPLTATSVGRVLLEYPLMTARVIGAIHWEALRLWRKGARYHRKPPYDPEAAGRGAS